jgi:hypothetical protein
LAAAQSETKLECLEAYEGGQRDLRSGRLLAAQQKLRLCASASCPSAMHEDCSAWLEQAEEQIPSVVVEVGEHAGALDDLAIQIDERIIAATSAGRAVQLDPGVHQLRVTAEGYQTFELSFTAREREKNRSIPVKLLPLETSDAPNSSVASGNSRPVLTVPVIASGSVALLGGAAFAFFGKRGRDADRELDACEPTCDKDATRQIRRDYLIANSSLGVGAAAALSTALFYVFRPPSRSDESSLSRLRVDWAPGVAAASYSGRF